MNDIHAINLALRLCGVEGDAFDLFERGGDIDDLLYTAFGMDFQAFRRLVVALEAMQAGR